MVAVAAGAGTIQAAIAANPNGTVFELAAGLFRVNSIPQPKQGQRFTGALNPDGSRATLMKGSQDISGNTWTSGTIGGKSYWYTPMPGLTQIMNGNRANPGANPWGDGDNSPARDQSGNNDTHEIFFNDVRLFHVTIDPTLTPNGLAAIGPDKYFIDWTSFASPRVYIGNNPSGQTVELSVIEHAFEALSGRTGVIIENVEITQFANKAGSGGGAIEAKANGSGWEIRNVHVHHTHGRGIGLGVDSLIYNSISNYNGQMGISPQGRADIQWSQVKFNNNLHFPTGWEAGGIKFGNSQWSVVRWCDISNNDGNGVWMDVASRYGVIEDNKVWDNSHQGIMWEISHEAVIRRNDCRRNGLGRGIRSVGYGSQILVASSGSIVDEGTYPTDAAWTNPSGAYKGTRGVIVEDNLIECADSSQWGNGIAVMQQARLQHQNFGPHYTKDVTVRGNHILMWGSAAQSGIWADTDGLAHYDPFAAIANNVWEDNTYEADPSAQRWRRSSGGATFAQFQAEGYDVGGTAITPASNLGAPVWVKRNGEWQHTIPRQRVSGAWVKAARFRGRSGGAWVPVP